VNHEADRAVGPAVGALGVWGHLDSLRVPELVRYVQRIEALGFDALWVPDVVGRDPFTLLGVLAGVTTRIRLGTSIVSVWGRDAQTTRSSALTLQEASGGRFVLGLGISHPHMAERLHGQRYDKPLTRMREYLAAYRAGRYRGPVHEAQPDPPVVLAALRERMLELAAREADGAVAYLVTAERVAWMRERLQRALLLVTLPVVLEDDRERARVAARAYLEPYLRTANYQASWLAQGFEPADWERPGSDRLVDAMVACGDAETIRRRIAAMDRAGADHVALIPLAPDGSTEHLPALEVLAPGAAGGSHRSVPSDGDPLRLTREGGSLGAGA
jgi:probable F420-dependent oxidoreductase